jgi:hypothetical protein
MPVYEEAGEKATARLCGPGSSYFRETLPD